MLKVNKVSKWKSRNALSVLMLLVVLYGTSMLFSLAVTEQHPGRGGAATANVSIIVDYLP